tara:strand:- start:4288 stop:4464 length:177 start_codon:yes stop_codon:yes gene_type:complete
MWIARVGFVTKDKSFAIGDTVLDSDIPKKSKKWIVEQSIIVKADSIEAKELFKSEEEE